MKFRGGGATRKTGNCCGLQKRHSGLDPESINADKDRLRLGGRSDEGGKIIPSSYRHSELDSESINADKDRLRLGDRSDEGGKITPSSSRHSELDSESINANKNRLHFDSKSDEKSRKAAFTMAEVLITLGIIGIVAAMTLPSLIGKYQEKQWKVAYKKAYSSMSQAFMRMQANDEFQDMSNLVITNPDIGLEGTAAVGENFKIMSKYFNTLKTCFDNNADRCWECVEGESGLNNGTYEGVVKYSGCRKSSYAFVDYSGMSWYLYSNTEYPVLVDVNGFNRPNKLGRDRFVMKFAINNSDSSYMQEANTIQPWDDRIEKGRWCPSGNCLYRTWLLE